MLPSGRRRMAARKASGPSGPYPSTGSGTPELSTEPPLTDCRGITFTQDLIRGIRTSPVPTDPRRIRHSVVGRLV